MPLAFQPWSLEINSNGRCKREHVESCFWTTENIKSLLPQCQWTPNWAGWWLNHERLHDHSDIFPSTFLQQENGSKNSILKWFIKLNFFMCFFLFCFWSTLERFPFYSPIPLTLWFTCLQARIRESCMYLSNINI